MVSSTDNHCAHGTDARGANVMFLRKLAMGRYLLAIVFLFFSSKAAADGLLAPPTGWRFPTPTDATGDWKDQGHGKPYVATADFNGDGLEDQAWILLKSNGAGGGLFVFIAKPDGFATSQLLNEAPYPQSMGVSIAAPGKYDTACGKKIYECEDGEPKKITLTSPAIDYFKFESANSFFVWDAAKTEFRRHWMSD